MIYRIAYAGHDKVGALIRKYGGEPKLGHTDLAVKDEQGQALFDELAGMQQAAFAIKPGGVSERVTSYVSEQDLTWIQMISGGR